VVSPRSTASDRNRRHIDSDTPSIRVICVCMLHIVTCTTFCVKCSATRTGSPAWTLCTRLAASLRGAAPRRRYPAHQVRRSRTRVRRLPSFDIARARLPRNFVGYLSSVGRRVGVACAAVTRLGTRSRGEGAISLPASSDRLRTRDERESFPGLGCPPRVVHLSCRPVSCGTFRPEVRSGHLP
jgi:hypothetical protein